MFPKRKASFHRAAALFFLSVMPGLTPIHAETAVLPFRVFGNPGIFSLQDGPEYLQEAFFYYFQVLKDAPVQDLVRTKKSVTESGFTGPEKLDHRRASRLCAQTGAEYLLTGTADFPSDGTVHISALSYSCRSKKIYARNKGSIREAGIQSLIQNLVQSAAPYARTVSTGKTIRTERKKYAVSVILDMSGSMRGVKNDIIKGLEGSLRSLPPGSIITFYMLKNGKAVRIHSANPLHVLREAEKYQESGRSGEGDLIDAMQQIENNYSWKYSNRLLVFTDISIKSKSSVIESRMIRLQRKGMQIQPFLMPGQKYEDRKYWLRICRIMNAGDPSVLYGRRIGFLEGYSRMLIMKGDRFYLSGKDASSYIQSNQMPEPVTPVQTVLFSRSALNLHDLPGQIAKSENLRLSGMGPVISGLERKIELTVLEGTSADKSRYKVLLNNRGRSFWIQIDSPAVYKSLIDNRGREIYVGLRFLPSAGLDMTPVNLAEHVAIRSSAYVPRMMVNDWKHFASLPANQIRVDDTWFFPVRVVDYKNVGQDEDIRQ